MNCNEFQANLDRYVDGELSTADMRSAADHATACTSCDSLVTSSQQLNALLTTAVTDRVTAVDVSGLWKSIEAELDRDPGLAPMFQPAAGNTGNNRPAIGRRFGDWLGTLVGDGAWIPARAGALAAAAAAVALMVSFQGGDREAPRVGPAPGATASAVSNLPSSAASAGFMTASAARTRVRPVRIDSMEVAAGHNVTTWMRPKTKTRVIWVGDSNDAEGFGVNTLSLDR